jgi:excisionase family DNA binding protein
MTMDRVLLKVSEVAGAIGLSRSKTYELISRGDIESVMIGRSRRVPSEAVIDFVERLRDRNHTPA